MRAREFILENAVTTTASIAPVAVALGPVHSRTGLVKKTKYANSAPISKLKEKHAGR